MKEYDAREFNIYIYIYIYIVMGTKEKRETTFRRRNFRDIYLE